MCDCTHNAHLQQEIYEFGKDSTCICSKDKTNEVQYTRSKRTPCLTDLVNHFFGGNKRPESRPPSNKKPRTSTPRQPTVETATVPAPVVAKTATVQAPVVAEAPPAPSDSVARPVTGGDEASIE